MKPCPMMEQGFKKGSLLNLTLACCTLFFCLVLWRLVAGEVFLYDSENVSYQHYGAVELQMGCLKNHKIFESLFSSPFEKKFNNSHLLCV